MRCYREDAKSAKEERDSRPALLVWNFFALFAP
jgi:hypothetical protein